MRKNKGRGKKPENRKKEKRKKRSIPYFCHFFLQRKASFFISLPNFDFSVFQNSCYLGKIFLFKMFSVQSPLLFTEIHGKLQFSCLPARLLHSALSRDPLSCQVRDHQIARVSPHPEPPLWSLPRRLPARIWGAEMDRCPRCLHLTAPVPLTVPGDIPAAWSFVLVTHQQGPWHQVGL